MLKPTINAPELFRKPRRENPSLLSAARAFGSAAVSSSSPRSLTTPARITFDRGQHPHICKTTAQYAGHRLLDLLFRRARILIQKSFRRHDNAAHAESALRRLLVDKRLLNRVRFLDRPQPLQCGDAGPGHSLHRGHTGADGVPVNHNRTSPALTQATTELRTAKLQIVAEGIEQRRCRVDFQRGGRASYTRPK